MKTLSLLSLVVKNNLVEGASAHWWSQRLSAFFLVILASWFIISIGNVADYEYQTIKIWISSVLNSLLLSLLAFTMIYHSSLGLEVIIEDYIHVKKTRELLLALNKIFHLIFFIIIVISIFFISTRIQ
ncbi:MAG: succinate dehydrogenase, hydrophobic membrane anchor protein [Woeseiaceae bacterium]|nr:succinate dehydrogenase, hydrophobic membrane anchor protein [Woeseiaceae bacterium]|tara:strand:- start:905 stop:1288 length:384 start_codon:yes stop_codon:yes gene_type:complete